VRSSEDVPIISAYDFIRDEASAAKLEKVREGKKHISMVIRNLPIFGTPRAKYLEVRREAIANMTASGYDNAEALFNQVWPNLKPTEDELKGG
jgi:hypothetical protein